jgi:hypothetical protein
VTVLAAVAARRVLPSRFHCIKQRLNMGIKIEVPVKCLADLQVVDSRVRTLCNTMSGAQCQSILTTEYQAWRRKVALLLLHPGVDPYASRAMLDAYMHGFRVRYAPPVCFISQNTPTAMLSPHAQLLCDTDGVRKRKWCSDPCRVDADTS